MTQLTFSSVCVIAALTTMPALAAPAEKPDQERRGPTSECSLQTPSRPAPGPRAKKRSEPMDCILVKGYPDQDGRAVLRRSLEDDAKKGLSRAVRPTLKHLFGKGRTS